ncbi:MAG: DNA polymerase ligase N-terminal domain-containing protein [Candidatus Bathyarchaeia archaeon]
MAASNSLREYNMKRNFDKTSEPMGKINSSDREPIFVIQKHDASTLHYDLRIQVEGVLKSWAVPKGPSTDPKIRRLAIPTEDHPIEYARFEGVIPEGEYGAGTVMVWDYGTYRNLKDEKSMRGALNDGEATLWLEGEKLHGGYALIRTGKPETGRWLLIKMRDEEAKTGIDITEERPESAISGLTLEEIASRQ